MTSCLILAAGQGSRLRPLTNNQPKGLVPLLGKPLIEHQLDVLKAAGINNIAIATGYKAENFAYLRHKTFHNKLFARTNMVESLFQAKPFFEQAKDDLIIAYGDIVYTYNNLDKLLNSQGDIVIMIDDNWLELWASRNEDPLKDAETLKYNDHGQIIELGKKPNSLDDIQGQYTGLIKIPSHKISNLIDFYNQLDRNLLYDSKTFSNMYMTNFLQLIINDGWEVMPAHVQNGWLEIDTVGDLSLYEKLALTGQLNKLWKPYNANINQ